MIHKSLSIFIASALLLHGCATSSFSNFTSNADRSNMVSELDKTIAYRTLQQVLETRPSGQSQHWHNSSNDHSGQITPIRTFKTRSGVFCREFTETITIADQTKRYRETACRDRDGIWKII